MSDVLSKLRDVQQKKLMYYSKTFVCLQESWPALSHVLNARVDGQQAAVSVESRAHSCGTFCKTSWPGRRN